MRLDIVTCLPELFDGPLTVSIIGRAISRKMVKVNIHNLRDYSEDKHRKVDDYAYGGGAGMVLRIEPIVNCFEYLQSKYVYDEVIYMSPDGDLLSQNMANSLSLSKNLLILCGHYKGIDQRVRDHYITKEISIGEYVISGGELAASVLVDSIVRLIPGVLSDSTSALSDSFQDNIIAPPEYTRPYDFRGLKVPEVLLSGNFLKISEWKEKNSKKKTI